jgi:hypothetical protein
MEEIPTKPYNKSYINFSAFPLVFQTNIFSQSPLLKTQFGLLQIFSVKNFPKLELLLTYQFVQDFIFLSIGHFSKYKAEFSMERKEHRCCRGFFQAKRRYLVSYL